MTRVKLFISSLILAIATIELAGCATFDTSLFVQKMPKATAKDPAVQILCMWQQAEGFDPDGRACKGFNGQILFLSRRKGTPVEVDGDVRIYLFDDQGTAEEQSKPLHQFDFDNGSWKVHLTKSSLGATYNVFIPYTRRDVSEADCSLRIRLKPKAGPMVLSEFSNMPLSGHKKPLRGDDAQPISKEEVDRLTADAMAKGLLQATTIPTTSTAKTKVSDSVPSEPVKPNAIQLASHEVAEETPKSSVEMARIRQLEAMMQTLLENQSKRSATPDDVDPMPTTQEPARLDDSRETESRSERFKLRNVGDRSSTDGENSRRTATVRKPHPLDDDKPALTRTQTAKSPSVDTAQSEQEVTAAGSDDDASSDRSPTDASESEFRRYRRKHH